MATATFAFADNNVPIAQPLTDTGSITLTLAQASGQVTDNFDVTLVLQDDWITQAKTFRTNQQTATTLAKIGELKINGTAFNILPQFTNNAQPKTDTGSFNLTLVENRDQQQVQRVTAGIKATLTMANNWTEQVKTLRQSQSQQTAMPLTETIGVLRIADYTFSLSMTDVTQPTASAANNSSRVNQVAQVEQKQRLRGAPVTETTDITKK
ncbi:MAG: hypothetical protein M3M85_01605 [bacterium]|nr:hypothetical protein [bacterium]